jgi:hypothetical protein
MTEEPGPTNEELRDAQKKLEETSRDLSEQAPKDEDTAQFDRRADKAAYLRRKLEERDQAEREAAEEDDK